MIILLKSLVITANKFFFRKAYNKFLITLSMSRWHNGTAQVVIILALISILGFVGIISETIFYYDLKGIIESLWILILGTGLLIETKYQKLKSMRRGLTNENFPHMTNFVI